jgi:hypothetical protein
VEIGNDYPDWMSICNCDEIYYVEASPNEVCGFSVSTAFYRAISYNGNEIEVLYWSEQPSSPETPELLAIGTPRASGWQYDYSVGSATVEGFVEFSE